MDMMRFWSWLTRITLSAFAVGETYALATGKETYSIYSRVRLRTAKEAAQDAVEAMERRCPLRNKRCLALLVFSVWVNVHLIMDRLSIPIPLLDKKRRHGIEKS